MHRRKFLAAAGAGLLTGGLTLPRRSPGAEARTVRGLVTGEGQPLAGVLVSDGCRVVRTDAGGCYHLPIGPDSGRFVFVTTPRDYWTDTFYVPLAQATQTGRADFDLRRAPQPEDFDFVFLSDMHLENRRFGVPKFKASLAEIQELRPTPAFLWAQGDICLQGHVGKEYLQCLAGVKIPVRNGPGNHEMLLEHKNPRDQFEELFGPTYYSFDWAGVHCIVLDGNKPIPGLRDWKAVHGAVEARELAWLRADLAAQPEGKPIIVGVHIPIVSTYPRRRQKSPENAPYWEITNHEALTQLLAQHRVRLVLQGHMHENERATVRGVEYVASIAIAGSWYQSGAGMERGVDSSPRGYRIVSVRGTRITHRYASSCESRVDRQGEFVDPRSCSATPLSREGGRGKGEGGKGKGESGLDGSGSATRLSPGGRGSVTPLSPGGRGAGGEGPDVPKPLPVRIAAGPQTAFVFNCYDAPNGSTAQARLDDGPWQPMPGFAAVNRSQGLVMPHHFRLLADTTALPPGRHHIEARVTWPDGTVVSEGQAFEPAGTP